MVVILMLLVLLGCEMPLQPDDYPEIDIEFTTLRDAWIWVDENIAYTSDDRQFGGSEWQTPKQVYFNRKGDCEDFCSLLGYFLTQAGYRVEMVVLKNLGEWSFHAILCVQGIYLDPQTYGKYYPIATIKDRIYRVYAYEDFEEETHHRSLYGPR